MFLQSRNNATIKGEVKRKVEKTYQLLQKQ